MIWCLTKEVENIDEREGEGRKEQHGSHEHLRGLEYWILEYSPQKRHICEAMAMAASFALLGNRNPKIMIN